MSITSCYGCNNNFKNEMDANVRFNPKIKQNVIFHKECENTIDWSNPVQVPKCALCGKDFEERFAVIDLIMKVLYHKKCIGDQK